MSMLRSINPSDYSTLGEAAVSDAPEIAVAKTELTLLVSREMGMPISEARADFDATLAYAAWYFAHAEEYLRPVTVLENASELHQVLREPIGTAAVIIPWNFPFANLVWGALQSLIAGNTIVLKHSEECPLSAMFLESIFMRHLPDGVFRQVYGDGSVGAQLVLQQIDMIAFTGSTKTGRALYEIAGKRFIKAEMELGGSAPGIIFADADLELAVRSVCEVRLLNAGQCCDGLKRLIVHESVYDEVVRKIAEVFAAKKIGTAEDLATELGPLVSSRQLQLLISQVEDAKAKGATVVTGGHSLEAKLGGAFFAPTVLTNVKPTMRVWTEEVFGPVLPIVPFTSEDEAVALANDTIYGLGAYVFGGNPETTARVARRIESGMVSVNGVNYVQPSNPFGGYKASGFGREHGRYGFEEVTRIKLVSAPK